MKIEINIYCIFKYFNYSKWLSTNTQVIFQESMCVLSNLRINLRDYMTHMAETRICVQTHH